jgi:hypothetical protein
MYTPASQSIFSIESEEEGSMVRSSQSISPFGPQTNPSTETDIFNTDFLIGYGVSLTVSDQNDAWHKTTAKSVAFLMLVRILTTSWANK